MSTITTIYDKRKSEFAALKIISLSIEGSKAIYNLDEILCITFNERSKLWYIEFNEDIIYSTGDVAVRLKINRNKLASNL